MFWFLKKKNKPLEDEYVSVWKSDFSDCVAADYLPNHSICKSKKNSNCRYVARYASMILCSNPEHKSFIPEGAEEFNPHKGQFKD